MAKMDEKRRKFLKHLGLLGFGALIGMGITHATSPSEASIIENLANKEIQYGHKLVWADRNEKYDSLDMNPPARKPREGGKPELNERVCAYHVDEDADGNYESAEELKYCRMPCKDVCPVNAISKSENSDGTYPGKVIPFVDEDKCIGCLKCFNICGYNAMEWINYP